MVVTIDSIMKPVFGAPVATGVASTGGMATQTPAEKMFGVFRRALVLVDQHEAARIAQALHGRHGIDALEGRQQHRELERQRMGFFVGAGFVALHHMHHALFNLADLGIDDPFDVALAHLAFHQAFGIAHAAQAHVADVRLAGYEGHRHLVAQLALAQVGIEDHDELVGRPEAAGALHRADHDRSGILQEFLIVFPCFTGMRRGADRLRETALRTGARHLFEGQARTGADQQIVVSMHVAVFGFHGIGFGIEFADPARHEMDVLLVQVFAGIQGDLSRPRASRPPARDSRA